MPSPAAPLWQKLCPSGPLQALDWVLIPAFLPSHWPRAGKRCCSAPSQAQRLLLPTFFPAEILWHKPLAGNSTVASLAGRGCTAGKSPGCSGSHSLVHCTGTPCRHQQCGIPLWLWLHSLAVAALTPLAGTSCAAPCYGSGCTHWLWPHRHPLQAPA